MGARGPNQEKWYQEGFQAGRDAGIAVGASTYAKSSDWKRRAVIGSSCALSGAMIFLFLGIYVGLTWMQTAALVGAGSTACGFTSQFFV